MTFSFPGLVNRCVHLQVLSVNVNRDKATDCVQQHPASFTNQMNNDFFCHGLWDTKLSGHYLSMYSSVSIMCIIVCSLIYLTTMYHEVNLSNDN